MSLYRKYRPKTFEEITGQEHVKRTIQSQLRSGGVSHAYLFTGPRGVGKTSVARLLAKAVNCEKPADAEACDACGACQEISAGAAMDIVEIDAASHTGVDNVRENIIESVRFAPSRLARKVFIIDEVHMLSMGAFNALLKTLEEPPAYALFVLATTEIHKVPETIISRCQRFDFRRIPVERMVARLATIAKAEGAEADEAVLGDIARLSEGCARDAEGLLGQILAIDKTVDRETASLVLPKGGVEVVLPYLGAVASDDPAAAVRLVNEYVEQGVDMVHFAEECVAFLRQLLFLHLGSPEPFEAAYGASVRERAEESLGAFDAARIREAIEELLAARRAMKTDRIPQLGLELAAVKLCRDFPEREVGSAGPVMGSPRQQSSGEAPSGLPSGAPSHATRPVVEKEEDPPPVEAEEVIADSVPVVSIDEVKRKWPDVFAQLKECNASLPVMMQAGDLAGVSGDTVELAFRYELYADKVNERENKRLLEGVMHQVLGKKLRIVARHLKGDEQAEDDETVAGLISEFGGSAVQ